MHSVLMNEIDLFVVNRAERSVKRTQPYAAENDKLPAAAVPAPEDFSSMLDREIKVLSR
ncbi:MAG: hypothetical protein K6A92_05635 [Lachnospiraceae bacterium]|nr:hypothetical protein [Lachnospiraceae bacterium]